MQFIWDEAKNEANKRKHGFAFKDAMLAFNDPLLIMIAERVVDGEVRWQTYGMVWLGLLMVVHTSQGEGNDEFIRIISARKATRSERRRYETENC